MNIVLGLFNEVFYFLNVYNVRNFGSLEDCFFLFVNSLMFILIDFRKNLRF